MGLYCTICSNVVPHGFSQCLACKAGFAPQLACEACRQPVPRGAGSCAPCERRVAAQGFPQQEMVTYQPPQAAVAMAPLPAAPPTLPGLPSHVAMARIPEQYNHGRFGVSATVQVPQKDVEIMTEMAQLVVILHTMASKMNSFQGTMASTREVIRLCRDLATRLQEEIETRRGPQG